MLGLPAEVTACLFDLDGVITGTAAVHAAAWKEMFDGYLRSHAESTGQPFRPFDQSDYERYVDGRPRADGTRAFLQSRGIDLPEGDASDPIDAVTVQGLGNRKNRLVVQHLTADEIEVFDGSLRYVTQVRAAGLRTALVSSSANALQVLDAVGITGLFDARVDGVVATERGLAGKPAPDTFLAAAEMLGAGPATSAVFEDALVGVEAGRAGGFALVVGVDRVGEAQALHDHGADVVVQDLSELLEAA